MDTEEILEIIHHDDAVGEEISVKSVKKDISNFVKSFNKNQQLRMSNDPQTFMESEVDLHLAIKNIRHLAIQPQFMHLLLDAVPQIIELLSHENENIVLDTLELISDCTDEDVENNESVTLLADSLVENHLPVLLVQNISRKEFNEAAIQVILGIAENLLEITPLLATTFLQDTSLVSFLLVVLLTSHPKSKNKSNWSIQLQHHASEVLCVLLQSHPPNYSNFLTLKNISPLASKDEHKVSLNNGLECLLRVLDGFRRREPQDENAIEMMENCFDALCAVLNDFQGKEAFVKDEGVELMILFLKEKKITNMRALKSLAFSATGLSALGTKECVEMFVDQQGLKYLFSSFMKKNSKLLKKEYPKLFVDSLEDEHTLTIINALFRHLNGSPPEFRISRLVNKFVENDFEKIGRLISLELKYRKKLDLCEEEIAQEREMLELEGEEIDDEQLNEWYINRMERGLSVIQMVDLILFHLMNGVGYKENPKLQSVVLKELEENQISLDKIKHVLKEYADNLSTADEEDREWVSLEQRRVYEMISFNKDF